MKNKRKNPNQQFQQFQVPVDQMSFFKCQCGSSFLIELTQIGYLNAGKASLMGFPSQDLYAPVKNVYQCLGCQQIYPKQSIEALVKNPSTQVTGHCQECKSENKNIFFKDDIRKWVCSECLKKEE
jgi:hypothetical protein